MKNKNRTFKDWISAVNGKIASVGGLAAIAISLLTIYFLFNPDDKLERDINQLTVRYDSLRKVYANDTIKRNSDYDSLMRLLDKDRVKSDTLQ